MKIRTVLSALLVFSLVMPIGFAIFDPLEFHKVHPNMKHDSKYGLYKIDTPFWGFDIADIELIENTDNCYSDCYAIFRIYLYQDISTDQKIYDLDFENKLTSKSKFNDYELFIRTELTEYRNIETCLNYKNISNYNDSAKTRSYESIFRYTKSS